MRDRTQDVVAFIQEMSTKSQVATAVGLVGLGISSTLGVINVAATVMGWGPQTEGHRHIYPGPPSIVSTVKAETPPRAAPTVLRIDGPNRIQTPSAEAMPVRQGVQAIPAVHETGRDPSVHPGDAIEIHHRAELGGGALRGSAKTRASIYNSLRPTAARAAATKANRLVERRAHEREIARHKKTEQGLRRELKRAREKEESEKVRAKLHSDRL